MTTIETLNLRKKILTFLNWILSTSFLLFATVAGFRDKSFISFAAFLLIGLLCLPPLTAFWKIKVPALNNKLAKIGFLFVLFIAGASGLPNSNEKNDGKDLSIAEKKSKA